MRTPTSLVQMVLLGLALIAAGCATVQKGSTQDIPFVSEPAGAEVVVDGVARGRTPITLKLERSKRHKATISLQGYETAQVEITPHVGTAVRGNLMSGGLIGWGIDVSTGAQNDLEPSAVYAVLKKSAAPLNAPGLPTPP